MTVIGSVVVTTISVVSVAVNTLFIIAVIIRKKLRSDMVGRLVLSLAVSDLCSGLFITGISAVFSWLYTSNGRIPCGALCVFQGFTIMLFGRSASLHLAIISMIKCYTIVRPLTCGTTLTKRFEVFLSLLLWLSVSVYGSTAFYVSYGMVVYPVTYYVVFTNPANIPLWVSLASYIVTTAAIFVSNAIIFYTVYKHKQRIKALEVASGGTPPQLASEFMASVKASKNLLIICVVFGVTFLPSFVALFIVQVQPSLPVWYSYLCNWGFMCHAFTDTLLYMVLHKNVRYEIRCMFRCATKVASESEHR